MTTTVLHAAALGIAIESLSTELVGDIDLQGDACPRRLRARWLRADRDQDEIEADRSDAELDDMLRFAQAHSPVCNTICRPLPVVVERASRD